MKNKIAITIIGLTVVFSVVACDNKDSLTEPTETNSIVEDSETIDTEVVATESVELTEVQESETEEQDAQEAGLRENQETRAFGASLPGEGTGAQKFYAWVQSQGADDVSGWTFIYYNGKAAGDQPSYGVYMKEGPLYGTVYHIGDTLPNGRVFFGTTEEREAYNTKKTLEELEESGNIYTDPETGEKYISFD